MRPAQSFDFSPLSSHYMQPGDRIAVSHGVAWLTIHGEDVLLRAGSSYLAEAAGHLVVESMPACRYQLQKRNPAAEVAAPLLKALRSIGQWYQARKTVAGICHHAR